MLLHEHLYRPIQGKIVTIGRNSVGFDGDGMDRLMESMGVPKREGVTYEIDTDTMGSNKDYKRITQESFFAAFTDATVESLDINDYEKASIICDLQGRIPWKYRKYADFIYDGGSLDNIFDPAASLKNISRMLKPGGRVFTSNNGGPHPTSYLKFSADWFMDFFAINNYEDCKTYICTWPNTFGVPMIEKGEKTAPIGPQSPYQIIVYNFNPYVEHDHGVGYDCSSIESACRYQIFCFAEKGKKSSNDRNPTQKHFRIDPRQNKICNASAKRFLSSSRPPFSGTVQFDPKTIPRIDSSDYPEQVNPVAVLESKYASMIKSGGCKPTK